MLSHVCSSLWSLQQRQEINLFCFTKTWVCYLNLPKDSWIYVGRTLQTKKTLFWMCAVFPSSTCAKKTENYCSKILKSSPIPWSVKNLSWQSKAKHIKTRKHTEKKKRKKSYRVVGTWDKCYSFTFVYFRSLHFSPSHVQSLISVFCLNSSFPEHSLPFLFPLCWTGNNNIVNMTNYRLFLIKMVASKQFIPRKEADIHMHKHKDKTACEQMVELVFICNEYGSECNSMESKIAWLYSSRKKYCAVKL